ncbi:MAG: acyl-ACP--UDP-N-acetylglucosamine O-acyltransferase [bacterium]|nr:acyl-ACP--UDP-N-acetylglucosamine O-acyltransferase [bacterium]
MIHKAAIIHPKAEIGKNVSIGPYSVIEEDVVINDDVKIDSNVVIKKWTTIGQDCVVYSGAVLGNIAQDKKFQGERSYLTIGKNNIIREYVTMHRGNNAEGTTMVGDGNFFMVGAHVAHNCEIGNEVVVSNFASIAGHVIVEDKSFISGSVVVHQFVRIGTLSMIGGNSKVVQDVPPYILVDGHPARTYSLNSVGLLRAGISEDSRKKLKRAYRLIFRSGISISKALRKIEEDIKNDNYVNHLIQFVQNSERGICRGQEIQGNGNFDDL